MGRKNRKPSNDKELKEVQRLRHENQKLRKTISSLRKQMSRVDIDRYQSLKEDLEELEAQDSSLDLKQQHEDLKKKWLCHKCKEDHLRIIMIPRLDGLFYIRKCGSCNNRTKLKKYTDEVEGVRETD